MPEEPFYCKSKPGKEDTFLVSKGKLMRKNDKSDERSLQHDPKERLDERGFLA